MKNISNSDYFFLDYSKHYKTHEKQHSAEFN